MESRLRCAGARGHGETISLKSLMVTGHKQAWAGFHRGVTAGLSAAIVLGAAQGQGKQWHLPGVPGSCCLIHTPAEYKGAEPPQMCPEPGAQDSVPGWPSGDAVPAYHPRRPCLVLHNHCPPNFFQVSPCPEFIRTRGSGDFGVQDGSHAELAGPDGFVLTGLGQSFEPVMGITPVLSPRTAAALCGVAVAQNLARSQSLQRK